MLHSGINLISILLLLNFCQINQLRGVFFLIKNHENPANHKLAQKLLLSYVRAPHPVKYRRGFIIKIAYCAAIGQRQLLISQHRPEFLHILIHGFHRTAIQRLHQLLFLNHQAVLVNLKIDKRLCPNKGKSAKFLMGIYRFQQKSLFLPYQLVVHGNRGIQIRIYLSADCYQIGSLSQLFKFFPRRSQLHILSLPLFVIAIIQGLTHGGNQLHSLLVSSLQNIFHYS